MNENHVLKLPVVHREVSCILMISFYEENYDIV